MPFQNVLVAGPGCIGTVMAVYLENAGHTVMILDHDNTRAAELRRQGIALRVKSKTMHASPGVLGPLDPLPEADLVLVAVKCPALADVGRRLADLEDSAVIVTLQNGLGVVEALTDGLGHSAARHRILAAVTYQAASRDEDKTVRHVANLPTMIDGRREYQPIAQAIAHLFREAGLPAEVDENLPLTVWRKLIANAAINPLSALANLRNGQLLERPPMLRRMQRLATETAAVARAEGAAITDEEAVELAISAARATADNISSMRQDVDAGRQTEIDFLNGAVVHLAALHGLRVPENEKIVGRISNISPL